MHQNNNSARRGNASGTQDATKSNKRDDSRTLYRLVVALAVISCLAVHSQASGSGSSSGGPSSSGSGSGISVGAGGPSSNSGRTGSFYSYLFTAGSNGNASMTGLRTVIAKAASRRRINIAIVQPRASSESDLIIQPALTSPFDWINISSLPGDPSCDSLQLYDPTSALCYSLATCSNAFSLSFDATNPATYFQSKVRKLSIDIGGQIFGNDYYCEQEVPIQASIAFASSVPFYQGPVYRYASLFPASVVNASTTDAHALLGLVQGLYANTSYASSLRLVVGDDTSTTGLVKQLVMFASPLRTGPTTSVSLVRSLLVGSDETEPLVLSQDGFSTTHCEIADATSFTASLISDTTDLSDMYGFDCFNTFAYVESAHQFCIADEFCIGYTTAQVGPDESVQCLVYAGSDSDDYAYTTRILYLRPSQESLSCTATMNESGTVQIFVQQTMLADSEVYIYDGDSFLVACGVTDPFIGRRFGSVGACGSWYLCYEGPFYALSTITVIADEGLAAGGCDTALGVVFNVSEFDARSIERPPPLVLPPSLLPANVAKNFPLQTSVFTRAANSASFYVRNVVRMLLSVNQTGYHCDRATTCPESQVTLTAYEVYTNDFVDLQTCGGSTGFYGDDAGEANQCANAKYCDSPTQLTDFFQESGSTYYNQGGSAGSSSWSSAGSGTGSGNSNPSGLNQGSLVAGSGAGIGTGYSVGYSGWITVEIDINSVLQRSTRCSYFSATLMASPWLDDINATSPQASNVYPNHEGFVLRTETPGLFRNLLALPINSSDDPAALAGLPEADVVFEQSLSDVFENYEVYLADNLTANSTTLRTSMSPNISFACVMDWITEPYGFCRIPVPSGSNYANVKIAQTYFTPSTNIMSVKYFSSASASVPARSTRCGGNIGFSTLGSEDGACYVLETCDSGFIYEDDALIATAPLTMLELRVPQGIEGTLPCIFSFAAVVDFEYRNVTAPTDCEFLCKADRACIDSTSICDGVLDCSDSADEKFCFGWIPIENASVFDTTFATIFNDSLINSNDDCKRLAIQQGSTVYALARNSSLCIVYNAANSTTYLQNPLPYLVSNFSQDFITFAYLSDISLYSHITSFGFCNNRGTVSNVTTTQGTWRSLCVCDSTVYTGTNCQTLISLSTVGPLFVYLTPTALTDAPTLSGGLSGLMASLPSLYVTCGAFFFVNGLYGSQCDITGSSGELVQIRDTLSRTDAVDNLNFALSDDPSSPISDVVRLSFLTSTPQAVPCDPVSHQCTLGVPTAVAGMSVAYGSDASGTGHDLAIRVRSPASSRRSGAPADVNVTCVVGVNMAQTYYKGCLQSNCVLQLNGTIADLIVPSVPTAVDTTSPCYSPPSVSVTSSVAFPPLQTSVVINTVGDYRGILAAGLIVLIVAAGVLVFSIILRIVDIVVVNDIVSKIQNHNSRLKFFLTETFRRVGHYGSRQRMFKTERISVGLAVVSSNVLIAGIFLLIFYATSSSYTSNTSIVLEEYRDAGCAASVVAPVPSRIARLDPGTSRNCIQREVAGAESSSIYAAGYCTNAAGGGKPFVHIQFGTSAHQCSRAAPVIFASGSCVPITSIYPDATTATYMLLTCATIGSSNQRFEAVENVTNAAAILSSSITPSILDTKFRQHWDDKSLVLSSSRYKYRRFSTNQLSLTTSKSSCRFESFELPLDVTGVRSSERLVVQTMASFDVVTSPFVIPELDLLETSLGKTFLKISDAQREAVASRNGDYPVGFTYNFFNKSNELAGAGAGTLAARYYGVRGSFVDIGSYFNSKSMQAEGDGFTISMNLRATTNTFGFAFAVTDGREDVNADTSPLLDRLFEIVANGRPDYVWFDNFYNVYSSFLIDGPSESVRFIYANPPTDPNTGKAISPRVVNLEWDLRALGLLSLLNGYWHNVVIKLRSENGQTKAQLIVDGVTSQSAHGWNQCVDRRPIAISALDPQTSYPVANIDNEKITTGGVLYTGYFNGGIANLAFTPENLNIFDIWHTASTAVRTKNRINGDAFAILGCLLIVVGAIFLVIAFATSGREMWTQYWRDEDAAKRRSFKVYVNLLRNGPTDPQGEPYVPMRWSVAKHLLKLSTDEFTIFMDQLHYNVKDPSTEIVRLVYMYAHSITGRPDLDAPAPTAAEWEALVTSEQDTTVMQSKTASRKFKTKEQDPEDLMEMFGSSSIMLAGSTSRNPLRPPNSSAADDQEEMTATMNQSLSATKKDDEAKKKKKANSSADPHSNRSDGGVVVNMGNTNFASNQQVATQKGDNTTVAASFAQEIKQLLMPLITTLQSVYVWLSTLGTINPEYMARFQGFFSFFCIDWSVALQNLSPIVTPLLQIFASLIVFTFVIYFLQIDELAFAATLGRYALRRDDIEGKQANKPFHEYTDDVIEGIDDPFDDFDKSDYDFQVPILSLKESQRVDQFLGRTSATHGEKLQDQETMSFRDSEGNVYKITKKELETDEEIKKNKGSKQCLAVESQTADTTPTFHDVGCRCVHHVDQRLRLQVQTNVWPFLNRPACCVVMNGRKCGTSTGPIYRCGYHDVNKNGRPALCPYALCAKHYRASPVDAILADMVYPFIQSVSEYGSGWLFSTIFLFLANTFYTPFLKTALMIFACNPYYQCIFDTCWGSTMDQKFILAVYLALCVIVFFGIGFPATLAFLLRRRTNMLNEIFFAEEYGSRFGDPTRKILDPDEWQRFVTTDPTALGTLYKSFEHQWLYVPPLILAWKVILLIPPVFIENGSLGQAIGVAVVEFSFAVFMFITSPSVNAIVDWMYKLGAIHQMVFLGLQNINVYLGYHRQPDVNRYLVATTLIYLIITAVFIVYSKIAPNVKAALETSNITDLLERLGMQYTEATGIFLVPRNEDLVVASPIAVASSQKTFETEDKAPAHLVDEVDVQKQGPASSSRKTVELDDVESLE